VMLGRLAPPAFFKWALLASSQQPAGYEPAALRLS